MSVISWVYPRAFAFISGSISDASDCPDPGIGRPTAGPPANQATAPGSRLAAHRPAAYLLDMPPTQAPPVWAGFTLDRPLIMGILNVTPDSFSDGGRTSPDAAIAAGLRLREEGADIVDVGGESTRPGADPVPPEEEQARVIPVIRALARAGVVLSVDTRNAATMAAALDAGARIINDVTALAHDPDALPLAAKRGCPVVLMHMRGTPATMSSLAIYDDVAAAVVQELGDRVRAAEAAGIARQAIVIDPGFGFAKHPAHSLDLLRRLDALHALGLPILAGVSRKGFIRAASGESDAARAFPGSIAAGLFALERGAAILRVHDVRETVGAVRVWTALAGTRILPFSAAAR